MVRLRSSAAALALAAACGQSDGATLDLGVRNKPDRPPRIVRLIHPRKAVAPGERVTFAAIAVDPDRDPIAFAWSQDCDGTFTAPAEALTWWSRTSAGTCTINVTATANGLLDSESFAVTVAFPTGTGGATVDGRFVPQPVVTEITLDGQVISRSSPDATLPDAVVPGAWLPGSFAFDLGAAPGALGATVRDGCGGEATEPVLWTSPEGLGEGTFAWRAPDAPAVCLVAVEVQHESLADGFSVAARVGF